MVRKPIGVRPKEIGIVTAGKRIRKIQSKVFFDSLGLLRTTENCKAIADEMKRVIAGLNRRTE